jgi:hypothetical protein
MGRPDYGRTHYGVKCRPSALYGAWLSTWPMLTIFVIDSFSGNRYSAATAESPGYRLFFAVLAAHPLEQR